MSDVSPSAIEQLAERMITTPTDVHRVGSSSDIPYRLGQISSVAGLANFPPTVTIGEGEFAVEARLGVNVWEVQPFDVVLYMVHTATPVIVTRLTGAGSPSLLAEDAEDEPDPWHVVGAAGEPAFATNWVAFGADLQSPRFRKTTDGWVWLSGLTKRSVDIGTDSNIFTLPEGYRPEEQLFFVVPGINDAGTGQVFTQVGVEPDGDVFWDAQAGATPTGHVGLNRVCFPTKTNPAAWFYPDISGGWDVLVTTGNVTNIPRAILRSDGWVWWQGMLQDPSPPTSRTRVVTVDRLLAQGAQGQMFGTLAIATNPGRFDIGGFNSTGLRTPLGIIWENPNNLLTEVYFGGMNYWPNAGAGAKQAWTEATLQNGWTNHGNVYDWQTCGYTKDAHGIVHLRGLPNESAATAATIFTLPVGYRPGGVAGTSGRLIFHAVQNVNTFGRIDIHADGTVRDALQTANGFGPSLTGIHFFAEQ